MEDTKVLSFNQLCESGFPFRYHKWHDEEGDFTAYVVEKSWGQSQNLIVYCWLVEDRDAKKRICFSVYQQQKYYMGLKDVPKGSMLNLHFRKYNKKRAYLDSWEYAA